MADLERIFSNLLADYGAGNKFTRLWDEIHAYYTGSKRYYHNLIHLENMYNELEGCSPLISDKDTLLFALYYHDIIYNASRKDNEEKSAALAVKRLTEINYTDTRIATCHDAIMATKTHTISSNTDINLFTDADLSILGSSPEKYQEYYKQIRKEYSVYPDFLYNPGRKKVLINFLDMDYIYKTQYFRDRYEFAARTNIASEIKNL